MTHNKKISIIIPIYNEEKTIEEMLKQLRQLQQECEIIFVDGGSTDNTLKMIGKEFSVLLTDKGRGHQMNEGARKSTGEVLFFLHCDSFLPEGAIERICDLTEKYQAGCLGIRYSSHNFFMWTCQVMSNYRAKRRKIMFGDQGIFIERSLFFEMGMFPELPLMEDYQFSRNLKKRRIPIVVSKEHITTSDRRYPNSTIGKLHFMWVMHRLRRLYRKGMDIEQIVSMYQDVR